MSMKTKLDRRAGVLVPAFSVYSKKKPGAVKFEDLKILVDWCVNADLSVIQLLPMNAVGPTSCPYDSISSFALETRYVSLEGPGARGQGPGVDAGYHKFCEENAYWLDDFCMFKTLKRLFKGLPWHEWNEGYRDRDGYMLEQFAKEHNKEILAHKWAQYLAYRQFKDLKDYASAKKILLKGDLPILVSRDSADVWAHQDFFKLEFAAGAPPDMYCAKGQRWGMPTYNWDYIEADEFIYIKEKLKFAENFYDILRIDHVVGLFRIWSIPYNEPPENQGLNGAFDPADENVWAARGKKLLSVLRDNTSMALCAEDLGIIPKACTDTLKELKIPGNDVQRWMKDWDVTHDFLKPEKYRQMAVAMLSTHDTTNWAAWWENEAGTVDEGLFMRKCNDRGIDFAAARERLFDPVRSKHKRLRWREDIDSVEKFIDILGKPREQVKDFIELYENSYHEKEKLWKQLGIKGAMREKSDETIVKEALKITMSSRSVLCVELIFDLLDLADICKGDPYKYRVNTPGTVSAGNWSLRLPIPLEELLRHDVNKEIKALISASGRALSKS